MKEIVFDFKQVIDLPNVLKRATGNAIRASIQEGFRKGATSGRKILRKAMIRKASQTTFDKKAAHKRVRRRSWSKKGMPLDKMRSQLDISTWPEHMAHFATKQPKQVLKKRGRRYFAPQISAMGKKGKPMPKGAFQPMTWSSSKKQGAKRASLKKGPAMRMIMKRKGDSRKPLKNSVRNDRALRNYSMYALLIHKSATGAHAAKAMFDSTFKVMDHQMRRRMKMELDREQKRNARRARR